MRQSPGGKRGPRKLNIQGSPPPSSGVMHLKKKKSEKKKTGGLHG